jgi:hypothetical protein
MVSEITPGLRLGYIVYGSFQLVGQHTSMPHELTDGRDASTRHDNEGEFLCQRCPAGDDYRLAQCPCYSCGIIVELL